VGIRSALDWLGRTAGVAALVIAVGLYRLQEKSGNEAHAELMGQIEVQGELLNDFAKIEAPLIPGGGGANEAAPAWSASATAAS
jgi:hypothetical protein